MTELVPGGIDGAIEERGFIADVGEEVGVLHIEDDGSFAELVSTFLERQRDYFAVETETDPQATLERLDDADVDCVVCDYDMPEMDGLAVLEQVREAYPDLPFVLFTGKGSEEIASEAISKGVTEYLQKGGGTEQYEVLANRIEQAVARYRAEQQVTRGFHAIETSHDGISLLNEDGEFIYVNEAYADITGYDREELLGTHWEVLSPEHETGKTNEEILAAAREGEWKGRTVYEQKGGNTVDVDHRLTFTTDDTMICTIADVSAAEAVREELSLKERAMDEAPIGITITDPRYTLYGLAWVVVGLFVLWRTDPAPTDARTRRRAAAVAVVYFLVLAAAGGVIVTAMRPGAGEYAVRVATLAPGWGPAPVLSTPWAALVLMPARVIGYLALAYLVYATVIDAAGAAVSGVVGLFSCISCTWPILASLLSGLLGSGSAIAAATFNFSYDISTAVFLVTVALLYWRPLVTDAVNTR